MGHDQVNDGRKNMIGPFRDRWRFLSNFWYAEVEYEGITYPSVEHAYQAAKTLDKEWREIIRRASKPGDAKRLGKALKENGLIRQDWQQVSLKIMTELVARKFIKHRELGMVLKGTGNEEIVEINNWHDNFYGSCTCARCAKEVKHNHLGRILMEVRKSLQ